MFLEGKFMGLFLNIIHRIRMDNSATHYYPQFIDAQITDQRAKMQQGLIKKIIDAMSHKFRTSKIIHQLIASFCFQNPIKLRESVFKIELRKNVRCGQYWLTNINEGSFVEIQIMGVWFRKQIEVNITNVMMMGHHLLQFLQVTSFQINTINESDRKWTLICDKQGFYFDLIKILKGYKQSGKINEGIVNTFKSLVRQNFLLYKMNGNFYIYIGNKKIEFFDKRANKQSNFSFVFERDEVTMNTAYSVVKKINCLNSRNQEIIISKKRVYKINDIFISDLYYA